MSAEDILERLHRSNRSNRCSSPTSIIIVRISRVKNLHRVASSLEHCRFRAFSIVKARMKETDFFSEFRSRFNDFRLLIFQPHLCSLQFQLRGLQRNREDCVLRVSVHFEKPDEDRASFQKPLFSLPGCVSKLLCRVT